MRTFPTRLLAALLLAAAPVAAQDTSVTIGDLFSLDFSAKLQMDWRGLPAGSAAARDGVFDIHRARVGVEGKVLKRVEYQLERNVADTTNPWRDAFVNVRATKRLEITAGHFKLPFSLAQLTPAMQLDFAYRPLAATYLAPGRDVGLMAHGTVRRGLKYQAGMFRKDGIATRVTVEPRRGLTFGGALTAGTAAEGLNSLRARMVTDDPLFPRLYVNGRRIRAGGELEWRHGPFSVASELMRATDQRRGQGIDERDLPDLVAQGWYVSGTWLVTGEKKTDRIRPAKPFLKEGAGALEIAVRGERLGWGQTCKFCRSDPDTSLNARADVVPEQASRVWTVGVNWYLNQWVRIQSNLIRERAWMQVFRVQVGL
jgi:phosphate-selective porin OprO/OprP